jgi:ABC-type glycerol-3-phosphate transport system permease component
MYGNIIFLIIPLGIFGSAFAIFLFANVMSHIPRELAEAAEIDGATRFQLMTRVMIPLMWPTVLTVALLLFVTNWNEYLLTLLLLPDSATQTVPLAVSAVNFGQFGGAPGQLIAAASALAALPSLLVFFIFQRALVRGITAGLQ